MRGQVSQFRAQRIELAFHARDLGLPRREGVSLDLVGLEGFDTPDLPVPPVCDPGSRQPQRCGGVRNPLLDRQAGGTPDGPVYQLAQIGEQTQCASRVQHSLLAVENSGIAESHAPEKSRPQSGGDWRRLR